MVTMEESINSLPAQKIITEGVAESVLANYT
jgi:hypothetical protein